MSSNLNIFYFLKWILSYFAIWIHNVFQSRKRFDLYDPSASGNPIKLGFLVPQEEEDLESPSPETSLIKARDEIFFYGVNNKKECLLIRVVRHPNKRADAWIHLRLENGTRYQLPKTSFYQSEGSLGFSCGDLKMHYLTPMRTWRIVFCGMLKEKSQDDVEERLVFVKFIFLWKASSDVYDLTLDTNVKGIAASMARSSWKLHLLPPIKEFVEAMNLYAQSGIIDGTVSVSEAEDYKMYLHGEKLRNLGKRSFMKGYKFTDVLGNFLQTGFTFHIGHATRSHIFQNLPYGFFVQPSGKVDSVKDCEIKAESVTNGSKIRVKGFAGEAFEIVGDLQIEPIILHGGEGCREYIEFSIAEFRMGKTKGIGIVIEGETFEQFVKSSEPIITEYFPETFPLTVQFSDEICCFSEVSGGKGSSLGKLTCLSGRNTTFIVPKGIVVTTASYEKYLTSEIFDAVKDLENVVNGNEEGNVKEFCDLASSVIEMTPMPRKICHSIFESLTDVFGEDIDSRKFAVRSSAKGEDTCEMSAAGQMETFLGVSGLEEIITGVKKCWASQFSFTAVEYKRQNGQILNSPMAVVIQEMVPCEVSGVLFTCDPVSNNPSVIIVTANYGLGETVVSGLVEPDTITLRRQEDGLLSVNSITLGGKHQKMVMDETGGTVIENLNEDLKSQCCLSEEMAIRLGNLSTQIEEFYRSPRDIEWGIYNDEIHILQSRSVTSGTGETEHEMKHEFDAPVRIENDFFTIANVGEVMPGATSPLGREVFMKFFSTVMKKRAKAMGQLDKVMQSKYFSSGLLSFYNHMMITVVDLINRFGTDTPVAKGFMISIFGRVLDDPELIASAKERAGPPIPPPSMLKMWKSFWDLLTHTSKTAKVKEKSDNYEMNYLKATTSEEAFTALMNSCSDFEEMLMELMINTENSSLWNVILLQILCEAKGGDFDTDIYSDFARLIATSSHVESADVPRAIQKLALHIDAEVGCKEFKSMSVEEAERWLWKSPLRDKFENFLKRHGHRCLKESDVRSVTWAMDPEPLVQLLQNMVGTHQDDKKDSKKHLGELFSELNVHLDFWSKLKLRLILPYCHKGVKLREDAKTLTVKSFDYLRQGFLHLSNLMVSEGRLPDMDLIFFLTLFEIKELLKTRSPRLLSRANNRRKIFSVLEGMKFPEMMRGIPEPINNENDYSEFESSTSLIMKGIPVSQGLTKGFARVALSVEEASFLKPGEVLITHCTDIGWAPYFPIVSGVATELGGLISHGAVVSREYGLPCVVGLQGATQKFQTGDYVLLDGKKGILQRLQDPSS